MTTKLFCYYCQEPCKGLYGAIERTPVFKVSPICKTCSINGNKSSTSKLSRVQNNKETTSKIIPDNHKEKDENDEYISLKVAKNLINLNKW